MLHSACRPLTVSPILAAPDGVREKLASRCQPKTVFASLWVLLQLAPLPPLTVAEKAAVSSPMMHLLEGGTLRLALLRIHYVSKADQRRYPRKRGVFVFLLCVAPSRSPLAGHGMCTIKHIGLSSACFCDSLLCTYTCVVGQTSLERLYAQRNPEPVKPSEWWSVFLKRLVYIGARGQC